ncbi:uncharacterized protein PRCAT00000212001 [Priceomyces carsonii]|uniref:uncharacterized protein n=1 Tax=Priceomyces carsonii TaxID=28549 RepID=UPI002EDB2012|nr:unnamed protein product [Priceomyces carsonii]
MAFEDVFSIQIFFIIFRETLETAIIISVLLSFINQRSDVKSVDPDSLSRGAENDIIAMQRKLKLQVWIGAILGFVVCVSVGLAFLVCFYFFGKDFWSYTERLWEGIFSFLSSIVITVMGLGLLRINKVMKIKWWIKLGDAYHDNGFAKQTSNSENENNVANENHSEDDEVTPQKGVKEKRRKGFSGRYFLAILPFVTTLREGLEAVVFVGGIGMSQPLTSLPLSIAAGALLGVNVGYALYRGGNKMSLQYFLIFLTCFLYVVSAGLMSRGIWFFELERYVRLCGGLDVSETGSGPGSYDISNSIWHVNCCNGLTDGWWMVFNAIFGWTNSATYGSVISYCVYWAAVIIWLKVKLYEEREGVLPFIPLKWQLRRIKKKLHIYEASRERAEGEPICLRDTAYHDPRSSLSLDMNLREAEAQVLLDS